jgi:hypothetical protein
VNEVNAWSVSPELSVSATQPDTLDFGLPPFARYDKGASFYEECRKVGVFPFESLFDTFGRTYPTIRNHVNLKILKINAAVVLTT